jgi:hypothetical protein
VTSGHAVRPEHRLEYPRIGEQPLDGCRIVSERGRCAAGDRYDVGQQPQVRLGEVLGVIGNARVHDPVIPRCAMFAAPPGVP